MCTWEDVSFSSLKQEAVIRQLYLELTVGNSMYCNSKATIIFLIVKKFLS